MSCSSCTSSSCVRRVPVFKGLSDSEIHQIESIVESNVYDKGTFVFREGEIRAGLVIDNFHRGRIEKKEGELADVLDNKIRIYCQFLPDLNIEIDCTGCRFLLGE